jgi:hypothetical protein
MNDSGRLTAFSTGRMLGRMPQRTPEEWTKDRLALAENFGVAP